jgi:hypothetical protein
MELHCPDNAGFVEGLSDCKFLLKPEKGRLGGKGIPTNLEDPRGSMGWVRDTMNGGLRTLVEGFKNKIIAQGVHLIGLALSQFFTISRL